jgi:predicted nucleotidyltransferase
MHHYLHMARNNFREFLKGERIRTNKYFYVLRPVFACLWLEQGRGPVPTEFQTLVDALAPEGALRDAIKELLANKRDGHELDDGPRIPVFNDFSNATCSARAAHPAATVSDARVTQIDTFFRSSSASTVRQAERCRFD